MKLKLSPPSEILAIKPLKGKSPSPERTKMFFEALYYMQNFKNPADNKLKFSPWAICFELRANYKQGLHFFCFSPPGKGLALQRLLNSYVPETETEILSQNPFQFNPGRLLNFDLKGKKEDSQESELPQTDAFNHFLADLSKLRPAEEIVYQLILEPDQSFGLKNFLKYSSSRGLMSILGGSSESAKNQAELFFKANLRLLISHPLKKQRDERSQSLLAALKLFQSSTGQRLVFKNAAQQIDFLLFKQRRSNKASFSIGISELISLFHLPYQDLLPLSENIDFGLCLSLPPSLPSKSAQGMQIGTNLHQGVKTPLIISDQGRKHHMYIMGGTGSGKTTFLTTQIIADIKSGRGLAVIDPHGDLALSLLRYIPKKRLNDVIYFDPADYKHPLGINLLQVPPGLSGDELEHARDRKTEALISVLKKVFIKDDADIGHRIEYLLRNVIQTTFSLHEPNLFSIFRLLNDPLYNRKIVAHLSDPYLKLFWQKEIGRAGGMQKVKMQAGLTAKIGRFLFSTSVKKVFNQLSEDCLDFEGIINQGKILICNFSKGSLGEDSSRLFGASVLAQIQLAALNQAALLPDKRPDFYLYMDEFQNFATTSFLEMMSEARKYGLYLIMAQQSLQQQRDAKFAEVILANAGSLIVFKTASLADSRLLLPVFEPFLKMSDLMNLPAYNFYAKLYALKPVAPISGMTNLPKAHFDSDPQTVIKASRKNYAAKSNPRDAK